MNISFKWALRGDEATKKMGCFGVVNLDRVEFFSNGVKEGSDGFVGCGVQHDRSPECPV